MLFSEHYGKEISAANAAVYKMGLADLAPEDLGRACSKALTMCRFMPTVADIRAQVEQDRKLLASSECDREWALLLSYAHWENPYGGGNIIGETKRVEQRKDGTFALVRVPGEPISEQASYAVRCIGGYAVIQNTASEHLPLLFKQFAEFYQNRTAMQGLMLSDADAKRVLGKVEQVKLTAATKESL